MKDTRRKERRAMTNHMTGTRNEWLAARLELLEAEKDVTRCSDEVARRRQELPWVRIDKEYRFETDAYPLRRLISSISSRPIDSREIRSSVRVARDPSQHL